MTSVWDEVTHAAAGAFHGKRSHSSMLLPKSNTCAFTETEGYVYFVFNDQQNVLMFLPFLGTLPLFTLLSFEEQNKHLCGLGIRPLGHFRPIQRANRGLPV